MNVSDETGQDEISVPISGRSPLTFGAPAVLFEHPLFAGRSERIFSTTSYDVTPDGERFVVVDGSQSAPSTTEIQPVVNCAQGLERQAPVESR